MAVGVPVVCSDIPVFAETAGEAALSVPVGDVAALSGAIEAVTSDLALRDSLITRGRARAAAHDWDLVARRAWALYAAVRESPRR
jgi:phosphatidylinositol alpha-mannosyltransferase